MEKPRVVIAETITDAGLDVLREVCELDSAVGMARSELIARLAGARGLVVRSATAVDSELIAAAPDLLVIGRAGIGVDNIDVEAATAAGILVVNAPDANTISAAEHTMALLLAQARKVPAAHESLRRGVWDRSQFRGVELYGKVLGVLGLGKIGTLVAQRAAAFGMRVVAFDPYITDDRAKRLGVELLDLQEVLRQADFLTIHLPRTRETEHLIDAEALGRMKRTARLINVARGGIVDEIALAKAIENGTIAGAAVDVFDEEPKTESPLFKLPGVVVTPHLGASTHEAQDKAGVSVAESVAAALRGELVLSAVNLDLGAGLSDEIRPFLPLAEQLGRILVVFSRGLPEVLVVTVGGRLAELPIRPITLAAVKGALEAVSDEPVSYVNATTLALQYGVEVTEASHPAERDYTALITLSGEVRDEQRVIAGTVMARKGPVLVEVDGYEIEVPLSTNMLLLRSDDVPGVIGRVGTLLGDAGVNIADMAVGHDAAGRAMMALTLSTDIDDALLHRLLETDGVRDVRFAALS